MHRRLIAATTLCATLLLAACTQQAPQPPPPPPSGPKMPSDPPPSATPSPTPSPNSKEHADLLHIQDLYKTEFAAETRVLMQGGATTLPPAIKNRTWGAYQQSVLESFKEQKASGQRVITGGRIVGVAMGKWTPEVVKFQACEDYTHVKSVDRKGHPVGKPGARVVQTYEVVKEHGSWRFDSSTGKAVKDFKNAPCDGKWYS